MYYNGYFVGIVFWVTCLYFLRLKPDANIACMSMSKNMTMKIKSVVMTKSICCNLSHLTLHFQNPKVILYLV